MLKRVKWPIILAVIIAALALGAGILFFGQGAGKPQAVAETPQAPAPRGYAAAGHEDDVLKGAAFSPPGENAALKPQGWSKLPLIHPPATGKVDLVLTLEQEVHEALLPYIESFARDRNVKIAVSRATCGIAASHLDKRQADIGGFCCPPAAADRLPGLRYHTLGIAPLALLAHPSNPVPDISGADVRKVFRGQIRYWKDLPGADRAGGFIYVVTRLHCKTRPGHWTLLLAEQHFSPSIEDAGDIPFLLSQVAQYPDAISYESLLLSERSGRAVKALRVNGAAPDDLAALVRGQYPFYNTINLTTWADAARQPLAAELVAWLQSVVEREGGKLHIASAAMLRQQGWRFADDELIGEPLR